jgi:hypothetical protein
MIFGVLALKSYAILPNHWHISSTYRQEFCQITGTLLNSIQAILQNHQRGQFCQITGTLLKIQAILPNHWHTPQNTGNSAKSLACSSTYRQFCQITGTLFTNNQFKQVTAGTLFHIQAILPNHWQTLSTDRQFCQITCTALLHIQAIPPRFLHHSIQAILPHTTSTPHTGNSAKSLAHCPQTDNYAKSLAQAILPNHWHTLSHIVNSAKSLAHCLQQTDNSAKSGTLSST